MRLRRGAKRRQGVALIALWKTTAAGLGTRRGSAVPEEALESARSFGVAIGIGFAIDGIHGSDSDTDRDTDSDPSRNPGPLAGAAFVPPGPGKLGTTFALLSF